MAAEVLANGSRQR